MKRLTTVVVTTILFALILPMSAMAIYYDAPVTTANAVVRDADGDQVGSATFVETEDGVEIDLSLMNMDPGVYGVHIHAVASCVPPDFTSAGGHFNPTGAEHGFDNPNGPHAGDLPNITVGADGTGTLEYTNDRITLTDGPSTLFDEDGSALVVHSGMDDHMTDPSGNSGSRVACGVIRPGMEPLGEDCEYFAITGHAVCDEILDFWTENGGLPVFGYPLTDAFMEQNPDTGAVLLAQYFERQRLEVHPENAGTVYNVLLGRLGEQILELQGRNWWEFPKDDPSDAHYMAETGFAIAPEFWGYWSSHGLDYGDEGVSFRESLLLFGYPISPLMEETNPDGDTVMTQWFERARFEHHPDNDAPYDILLGRLGAELLDYMGSPLEVISGGLANPNGLEFGPDGALYLAESGSGGDDCVTTGEGDEQQTTCVGMTGEVSKWVNGEWQQLDGDFYSVAGDPEGFAAGGVVDVAVADDGTVYALTSYGGNPADRAAMGEAGDGAGVLYMLDGNTWTMLADIAGYEGVNNPDPVEVDSNPYSVVAADGGVVVADAGGNDLLWVADDGTVSTMAVFPAQMVDAPFPGPPPGSFPMESVPTSVVEGPDGAYYVGELTGFPAVDGLARVWRVSDDNDDGTWEQEVYATGFTSIMDIEFGPDGTLYVLELSKAGWLAFEEALFSGGEPTPEISGAVYRVEGSNAVMIAGAGLIAPSDLAIDAYGAIYVANYGVFPDMGQVVRLVR